MRSLARRATPETFEDHVRPPSACFNLRQFTEAREHIAKALKSDGFSGGLQSWRVLFEMLEDYDRAKRYYGQAIRLNRNYEPAQQNMRRIYELFQFGSSREPFNLGDN
jgi:tetratricopeptide (TPR) repeat protein